MEKINKKIFHNSFKTLASFSTFKRILMSKFYKNMSALNVSLNLFQLKREFDSNFFKFKNSGSKFAFKILTIIFVKRTD